MLSLVVIGTGYVGLVSGACLASLGHRVTCVDIDATKIAALQAGACPLFEAGLPALLDETRANGSLTFATTLPDLATVDAVFLGVGTPQDTTGRADMRYIDAAFAGLLPLLGPNTVVVTKSTVPVGTCERLTAWMASARPDLAGHLASNPEFLREGTAVRDFLQPDRIVSGARTPHAHDVLTALYKPLTDQGYPHLQLDPKSAELAKYAANAFLATKVSFINEIAGMCEALGADVNAVAKAIGSDTRIGSRFLRAGPGYGGSCFPKDTAALLHIAQDAGVPAVLTQAVMQANTQTQARVTAAITALAAGKPNPTVACLGLAFKPGTDDMRDAPALTILPALQAQGMTIKATDPAAMDSAKSYLDITYCTSVAETLANADILVLMTEWPAYVDLDPAVLRGMMNPGAVVADLRRGWDTNALYQAGFAKIYQVGTQTPH